MKVFMLKQEDFDKLILMITKDPGHGQSGGSSQALSQDERQVYDEAHRFYNYNVRKWISDVSS